MLLNDTRYRSTTIQVIALIAFMVAAVWLINNVRVNLALAGKPFEFGFLWEASDYDINQKLLEYNSQSTHMRAAVIGLLNTLLVAVMGCALATFIGVFVGVLRLSKNWIISRLALVYVETFRNVPVLLWISLAVVAFSHTLPSPKDFRGENATASMSLFDSVAITNRGVYLPEPLFSSGLGDLPVFWNSFEISLDLIAILCVFISGILLSKLIKYRATNIQNATGVRPTTWYWSLAAIFLPTLIVLYILGFYLGYPEIKGFNFKGGIHMRSSLLALWLALSLYTGAFIAEIVRAGILAISKGQTEAAESLGLRSKRIMGLVVLPQAMRVIVPPLISQYLNLTKNSSLAVVAGYMDITQTLGGVTMNQTGREMESILLLMMCYLIISLIISGVMNVYNERTKLKER
ncbi:MAG: amino acid ABC transporter permease [Rhodobacterales bacterium]|nr:MAG: amino acid ABC transporter permease [Rhodobacterales bacterium]